MMLMKMMHIQRQQQKWFLSLKTVNDTAERAVKPMQVFMVRSLQRKSKSIICCVQEHRNLYPYCKKETIKRKYPARSQNHLVCAKSGLVREAIAPRFPDTAVKLKDVQ
ncbi:unnamed protein product [Pieris macdunnoughi]|uniref:Uncharacterized protein n=1 Tax=Pieris macdunnoughi TaxID=345717 RepID=A0A821WFS3_9NEOP|nr:unnamed protein product [Pieris macdunnoughi]